MVGSRTAKVAALVGVAAASLALTLPATPASAQKCNPHLDCSNGVKQRPKGAVGTLTWGTGWVTYVKKAPDNSWSSEQQWTAYQKDQLGHCWDANNVGVGCP